MAEIALSLVMRLVQEISARLLLDASVLAQKEASLLRSVPGNIRYGVTTPHLSSLCSEGACGIAPENF
jgi:hypothetical protein